MARGVARPRALLLGSQGQGALTFAGHDVELIADETRLRERLAEGSDPEGPAAELLVVDLTDADLDGAAIVESITRREGLGATRTLGFYSHVEAAMRERAERAGFDLVVPRSRMAREGPELVAGLL